MKRDLLSLGALAVAVMFLPAPAGAEVLGPCGTKDANKPAAAPSPEAAAAPAPGGPAGTVARVPLPGEQAPNFQLAAVVGDKVKEIKLSDYDGKWRVICFYPADFTFV